MIKQTFGIILTTRSFFPSHLVAAARAQLTALLGRLGYGWVLLGETDTPLGAVRTLEDAMACAALFRQREDICGVLVCLPNFGEELGVAEALDRANLGVPVLVQACDDTPGQMDLAHRRDAFCGKISLCNNLYQRGIRFTGTRLHTCALDSPEFEADLRRFAKICAVVRGLRGARVAMLGARPLAFNTVRFSEKILQRHGISVQTVDLSEVLATAEQQTDPDRLAAKAAEIRAYGRIAGEVEPEKIHRQAKLCLAFEQWMEDLRCQASAVQCWDSLEHNYGCAACLGMSMMGEQGRPSACECDVTGAVTMLAAQLAAGGPPALMDWNNNLGPDRDCCVALHCSNFPKSFFQNPDLQIGSLDVLGTVLGQERTFGALKGQVAPGPMTFARLTTDDARGVLKLYVGEGEFLPDPVATPGGVAACRVPGLQALMEYICRQGFEHHVCFVRGHVAEILREALGTYMGAEVYWHQEGVFF
jgi:L-fucose isomerase-like protein